MHWCTSHVGLVCIHRSCGRPPQHSVAVVPKLPPNRGGLRSSPDCHATSIVSFPEVNPRRISSWPWMVHCFLAQLLEAGAKATPARLPRRQLIERVVANVVPHRVHRLGGGPVWMVTLWVGAWGVGYLVDVQCLNKTPGRYREHSWRRQASVSSARSSDGLATEGNARRSLLRMGGESRFVAPGASYISAAVLVQR